MRALWWCVVASLLTLAAAGTIRRTSSVEASPRSGRRLSSPEAPELEDSERTDHVQPPSDSLRPRSYSRRRDGSTERQPTRNRSRNSQRENPVEESPETFTRRRPAQRDAPTSYVEVKNNDRNSRSRFSRTRSKASENNEDQVITSRNKPVLESETSTRNSNRARTRVNVRVVPTPSPIETSSPIIDERKIEVISSTLDDITQAAVREDALITRSTERTTPRIRTRSRFTSKVTTEEKESEDNVTRRSRVRVATRSRATPKPQTLVSDSVSSETVIDATLVYKEPTTPRITNDLRSSRKLRYKTRLSESETNLTGEGTLAENNETKTSQILELTPSQTEKSAPTKITFRPKVIRKPYQPPSAPEGFQAKPVTRGRLSFKPSTAQKKSSKDSEISEDDNYPESFKALLQSKNPSPQAETHKSESLSVKASQKVFNTFSPTSADTKSSNPKTYTRILPSENSVEALKRIDSLEDKEIVDSQPSSTPKPFRKTELKNRTSYLPRYRKSTSLSPSTTEPTKPVLEKRNKYKFNRPNKLNNTIIIDTNNQLKDSDERSKHTVKKTILRSSYYSRLRTPKPKTSPKIEINETDSNLVEEQSTEKSEKSEEETQPSSLNGKYHSSYKDEKSAIEIPSRVNTFTLGTPIRNIHSRLSLAKVKNFDPEESAVEIGNSNIELDETSKAVSESYSKSTFPTTNVIPEYEKAKSRFSSKYRAPFDKPMYQPTVPSVTPSTAWLKFYVTDTDLKETLREPVWYLDEDENVIAETQDIRETHTLHRVGSTDPDVGEENEIGPDINIISFNKPQSTPSSADLKLAETVPVPSQLIHVETSLHSPSVTVSIYDALAEILTSTPKTTPSSTPEVKLTPDIHIITNPTPDGVSSIRPIALSVPQNSIPENTPVTTTFDIMATTKPVHSIIQQVADVINDVSLGTSATTPTSAMSSRVTDLPRQQAHSPVPSPMSVTPTSRKPFATIILYSTTVPPTTDAFTTASQPTTNHRLSTTESSSMVFNTVSDLILSNNNLISSQLTSMLSSNINDILLNMDEESRTKVSVNMNAIIRSLSGRALVKEPSDTIPETTPFSEDDILATQLNDTAIQTNDNKNDDVVSLLGSVMPTNAVNEETGINKKYLPPIPTTTLPENQTIVDEISSTIEVVNKISQNNSETHTKNLLAIPTRFGSGRALITPDNNSEFELPTTTPTSTDDVNNYSPTTPASPKPFILKNKNIVDSSDELTNVNVMVPLSTQTATTEKLSVKNTTPNSFFAPLTLHPIMEGFGFQDPCLLTPAQFWGLSKKARVLKIIEDIIRQHNVELMTTVKPPLTSADVTMSLIRKNAFAPTTEKVTSIDRTAINSNIASASIDNIVPVLTARIANPPTTSSPALPMTTALTEDDNTDYVESTVNGLNVLPEVTSVEPITTVTSETSFVDITSRIISTINMNSGDLTTFPPVQPTTSTESIVDTTSTIPPPIVPSTQMSSLYDISPQSDITTPWESTTSEKTSAQDISLSSNTTAFDMLATTSPPTSTSAPIVSTTVSMDTILDTTTTDSITTSAQSTDTPIALSDITTEVVTTIASNYTIEKETIISTTTPTPAATQIVSSPPKKDYVIFGILPNNTVVRKNPNEDPLESLTEASPYIIYGVLPNNTIIRRFPNGTRVPRVMQRIDVLPISPWSLRNPYSPIHNNPAIVKPSNPAQQSINVMTPSNNTSSNGVEITGNTVNNTQPMISSQSLSINGKGTLATIPMSGDKAAGTSTLSHVLSLRTTTMLPSINDILLNSISSATREEKIVYIPAMTSSTREPRILTLDIDPETKMIRTERPDNGMGGAVFKFIPIDEVKVEYKDSNVLKLATTKSSLGTTTDVSSTEYVDPRNEATTETITLVPTTKLTKDERLTTEIPTMVPATTTTERTTTTTTTVRPPTTPKTVRTTTLSATTDGPPMSTTILPTMFTPRRVQFRTTTESVFTSDAVSTTQRRRIPTTTTEVEDQVRISTTNRPVFTSRTRPPNPSTNTETIERTTMRPINQIVTTDFPFTSRVVNNRFGISTTDLPTSTFSVEDDIAFLNNLKSVVNTNSNDPETALANRIIALAVERSLSELNPNSDRTGKNINIFGGTSNTFPTTTTTARTTTTITTTTTPRPTTTTTQKTTPSIEEDIKQFQEDTKLLQALLKATGQNPANFKIPAITTAKTNVRTSPNKIPSTVEDDLKFLENLLASPSPLNEPFDSLTPKINTVAIQDSKADTSINLNVKPVSRQQPTPTARTTAPRNGNAITSSIKGDLKSFQEDTKLLETLLQLQGGKTTTTPITKITHTGITGDEALASLLAQTNKVSTATKAPISLSTEFGNSNDALLAALLKEQGFGPTTANSIEEQVKLAALLNQVVVTPKPRRVITSPPPPLPPPAAPARRPIIDGLAWLWQQWQETAPGPGPTRGARRPAIANASPTRGVEPTTSPRGNWFGSGPFVGNAEDPAPTSSNRVPLEPPGETEAGRGQLVSAAINVTRAFSQFLGAAIQGAAKTVQNVIKAGRQAATDVYASGSG